MPMTASSLRPLISGLLGAAGLFVIGFPEPVRAQNCDDPVTLCGDNPQQVVLDWAQPTSFACLDAPYVSVFSFTTNSQTDYTGPVSVELFQVSCQTSGAPDVIQAVVVRPNPQSTCDESAYEVVGTCQDLVGPSVLTTVDLEPNTLYLVLLGTSHDPAIGPCAMGLNLSGPGVGIDVCCTALLAPGQSTELTVSGGNAALGYTWFPETGLSSVQGTSVTASPDVTVTYSVTGFIGACAYTDAVTVSVGNPLDLPNGFTPNGDEVNDFWTVPDLVPYERARVMIFDRWGQVVFRSIGYPQPWDGTREGTPVPAGTYYYTIELNDPQVQLEAITGYISVVR